MRPSSPRLSGWTRARIRANEQRAARTRLAQRPADKLTPLERARALLRDRLSMHLQPAAEQPSEPKHAPGERTRLQGLWWLPVVGSGAERQALQTLADFWCADPARVDAGAVRALERDATDGVEGGPVRAVAVLVSAHGFRRAGVQRALHSAVPFLLLHLPVDARSLPSGPVGRSVKVDSALDLDYACGASVANETLKQLLGGRLHVGWDRVADEPDSLGAREEGQSDRRREALKILSTFSVPTLYWAGIRLPDVDTAKKSASFAKRLEERQRALRQQQGELEEEEEEEESAEEEYGDDDEAHEHDEDHEHDEAHEQLDSSS